MTTCGPTGAGRRPRAYADRLGLMRRDHRAEVACLGQFRADRVRLGRGRRLGSGLNWK